MNNKTDKNRGSKGICLSHREVKNHLDKLTFERPNGNPNSLELELLKMFYLEAQKLASTLELTENQKFMLIFSNFCLFMCMKMGMGDFASFCESDTAFALFEIPVNSLLSDEGIIA